MSHQAALDKIVQSIIQFDAEGCKSACEQALNSGLSAQEMISGGLAKAMEIVGQKYETNEFFLSELIVAGEVCQGALDVLKPHMDVGNVGSSGKVVVGTVKGDLHDIGKNVFAMLMRAAGFVVVDLGANVSSDMFVEAVRKNGAKIVGLSALLSTSMEQMEEVIIALQRAGVRDSVKIILGGAPITVEYAEKVGADYGASDAIDGVNHCKSWLSTG